MNRVNKFTSVFTIALFTAMLAVPFLNASECDMECCTVEMPMDCGINMDIDTCCPAMAECTEAVFIPIVSAPILKVNVEKNITSEYLNSYVTIPNFEINESTILYQLIIPSAEAPPGFQTPLLV